MTPIRQVSILLRATINAPKVHSRPQATNKPHVTAIDSINAYPNNGGINSVYYGPSTSLENKTEGKLEPINPQAGTHLLIPDTKANEKPSNISDRAHNLISKWPWFMCVLYGVKNPVERSSLMSRLESLFGPKITAEKKTMR